LKKRERIRKLIDTFRLRNSRDAREFSRPREAKFNGTPSDEEEEEDE